MDDQYWGECEWCSSGNHLAQVYFLLLFSFCAIFSGYPITSYEVMLFLLLVVGN